MKRGGALLVAVVLVLVTLGVLAGLGVSRASDLSSQASLRTRIVSLAGEYAVDYGSLDYRHMQADIQAETKNATPQFATRYRATIQLLAPIFTKRKLAITGSVDRAGISSLSSNSAVVLVALIQRATSSSTTNGVSTLVRMRVSLSKVGGRWLANDVARV